VFLNALAPCAPPCSDAQNAAAAAALRARVLATGDNASLLASVLPPGMVWALYGNVVIPYTMPRERVSWRALAMPSSLPGWVAAVGAAAGTLACGAAAALLWRRARCARKGAVSPEAAPLPDAADPEQSADAGGGLRPMRGARGVGAISAAVLRAPLVQRAAPFERDAAPAPAAHMLLHLAPQRRAAAAAAEALRASSRHAPGVRPPLQQSAAYLARRAALATRARAAATALAAAEAELAELAEDPRP
jgi:hypothetical protein